jgi:predicted secreted protein
MGPVSGIVVYLLAWWVTLFAVLPWGNQPVAHPGPGHAPSAPANPRLRLKFIVTSAIAAVIWLVIFAMIKLNVVNFHDISVNMMRKDGFK